jgi:hypothetical protein
MDFDSVDARDHRDHQTLRTALRCNDRGIVRISVWLPPDILAVYSKRG